MDVGKRGDWVSMIVNNEKIYELTYEMRNNLNSLQGLIDKLSEKETEKSEKDECIEAMRDFVKILLTKTDDITQYCSNNKDTIDSYTRIRPQTNFRMINTKALIVDDNEINNYVVAQTLNKFDIKTDIALTGERAVELFEKNDYDIILMDYLMPPGMNGVETVAKIRSMGERGEQQLIIGLTAHTVNDFKEGLNRYGVELRLFKPIALQQIRVILQQELPHKIRQEERKSNIM